MRSVPDICPAKFEKKNCQVGNPFTARRKLSDYLMNSMKFPVVMMRDSCYDIDNGNNGCFMGGGLLVDQLLNNNSYNMFAKRAKVARR